MDHIKVNSFSEHIQQFHQETEREGLSEEMTHGEWD